MLDPELVLELVAVVVLVVVVVLELDPAAATGAFFVSIGGFRYLAPEPIGTELISTGVDWTGLSWSADSTE